MHFFQHQIPLVKGGNMKKWHMEGIISAGRISHKLEIPNPGQRTLWSAAYEGQVRTEFFLLRMLRTVWERVQRQY